MDTVIRRLGAATLLAALVGALAAPWLAPHVGEQQFRDYLYAPPMRVRVVDADGHWHAPFVHRWRLADRVMRSFDEDRSERYPLRWFVDGRLVGLDSAAGQPLLLLGGDGLGRDLLSRLLLGARTTLGVAFLAAIGAVLIGVLVGGVAGYAGGIVDETLMRFADLVLVLPTIYAVLALRAVLPPVLSVGAVFWLLVGLLALVGWPYVARGVRAIVAAERGPSVFSRYICCPRRGGSLPHKRRCCCRRSSWRRRRSPMWGWGSRRQRPVGGPCSARRRTLAPSPTSRGCSARPRRLSPSCWR